MSQAFPHYDVLISYSTKRKEVAEDFASELGKNGIHVWIAPFSIPAGSQYPDEIYAAIDNSDMVLFVLCEESLNSKWCVNELRYALTQNKKVLPVQITEIENPYARMRDINRRLSKRQIFALYPEYRARIDSLIAQSRALLTSNAENVSRPYPRDNYDFDEYAELFVGREAEIGTLHDMLLKNRIVNLYGMGGIGKTALMRKFFAVYEEADAYHSMHVAPYTVSLQDTIAAIPFAGFDEAEYLKQLPKTGEFSKTQALYERKLQFLQQLSSECLLVLDGADNCTEEELRPLRSVGCNLIITSRKRYQGFLGYELKAMNDDALIGLFFSYARLSKTAEEECAAKTLIARAGGHTLTLKLLGCYAYNMGFTAAELLEEDALSSLAELDTDEEKISTLFRFSELAAEDLYALQILSLFPNGISKGKLQKIERTALRRFPELAKRGWVIASDTSYALHQIVQQCVLTGCEMTTDALRPFLTTFAEMFRSVGFENAELHLIVRRICSAIKGDDHLAALLFHRLGTFIGDYSYADTFHIPSEIYESQNMNVVGRTNSECVSFAAFDECFEINERALKIAQALPVQDYDLNAFIISCMGSARFNQNKFSVALDYQRRALAEIEKKHEEDNPVLLIVLSRRGITALETGDYDDAKSAFERYLHIAKTYRTRTGSPAMALFYLGELAYKQGDFSGAEEYYLASERENPDDPETSFALSELWMRLAFLCKGSARESRAREYFLRARGVKEKILTDEKDFAAFAARYDKEFL